MALLVIKNAGTILQSYRNSEFLVGYVSVTLLSHFSYDFTITCYENLDLKLLFFGFLICGSSSTMISV